MSKETIYVEKFANGVARIVLNRPESLNVLTMDVMKELGDKIEQCGKDKEVRVIILTSSGNKAFVAGADIAQMSTMGPVQFREYGYYLNRIEKEVKKCTQPVIAAIKGFCFGGGNIIAMSCDLVFATEKSSFGQQEINLGIMGGLPKLASLVGMRKAFDIVLTGRIFKAKEAEEMGMINSVLPEEGFEEFVAGYANKIAEGPLFATQLLKASKNMCDKAPLETAMQHEEELMALCFGSEDAHEGMKAFVEKRKPNYTKK